MVGNLAQADKSEYFVDAFLGDAVGGGEPPQVLTRLAARVDIGRNEQRADLSERVLQLTIWRTTERGEPRTRAVEPEEQAHRCRLAGSVRTEETSDVPWLDVERQLVDCKRRAVLLRESHR